MFYIPPEYFNMGKVLVSVTWFLSVSVHKHMASIIIILTPCPVRGSSAPYICIYYVTNHSIALNMWPLWCSQLNTGIIYSQRDEEDYTIQECTCTPSDLMFLPHLMWRLVTGLCGKTQNFKLGPGMTCSRAHLINITKLSTSLKQASPGDSCR